MKADAQINPNPICGYCQTDLDRSEPERVTSPEMQKNEARLGQGKRLREDPQHLSHHIEYYFANNLNDSCHVKKPNPSHIG